MRKPASTSRGISFSTVTAFLICCASALFLITAHKDSLFGFVSSEDIRHVHSEVCSNSRRDSGQESSTGAHKFSIKPRAASPKWKSFKNPRRLVVTILRYSLTTALTVLKHPHTRDSQQSDCFMLADPVDNNKARIR